MGTFLQHMMARSNVRQIVRFLLAGGTATIVQYTVLVILIETARVRETLAAALAYFCGMVVSFVLNRRFTFADSQVGLRRGFAIFAVVNLFGLGLNTIIFDTAFRHGAHYILAQVIATGFVLIWNYAGMRMFVFR